MIDQEPTNEQLANFLMVYAGRFPEMAHAHLDKTTLERLMDSNPQFREGALRHHRRFQEDLSGVAKKLAAGQLQCEYIRSSKKRCPNHNEPGSFYCGLHKDLEI